MSVPYGIYFIQTPDNVPRALAWGDTVTLATKWPWNRAPAGDTNVFLELWLVEPLTTCGTTCTIRNLKNGKYMILDNEDSIILDDPAMDASEQWNIVPSHFLGFTGSNDRDIVLKKQYQPWIFQRLSRSGGEIQKGISILCGLMLGRPTPPAVEGQKAFNFTLTDDYLAVLFFDSDTGEFKGAHISGVGTIITWHRGRRANSPSEWRTDVVRLHDPIRITQEITERTPQRAKVPEPTPERAKYNPGAVRMIRGCETRVRSVNSDGANPECSLWWIQRLRLDHTNARETGDVRLGWDTKFERSALKDKVNEEEALRPYNVRCKTRKQ
ncbi:hypothetical protein BDR05DRAFT_943801 [Suillus weaverae]|nr:hypothetical protein BDR05DRAFT_943801 [Suillus weaverae]